MPKSRSHKQTPLRGKLGKGRKNDEDDEESICDTASILSANSDRGSLDDDLGNEGGSVADPEAAEALEEKFIEAIEGLIEKSASRKMTSLSQLTTILSQNYIPDIVMSRKDTIIDYLEKILKRGSSTEKPFAAALISLVIIQIGAIDEEGASELFGVIKPVLHHVMMDHTVPIQARIKACHSLCFGSFIAESGLDDLAALMSNLEPFFDNRMLDTAKALEKSQENIKDLAPESKSKPMSSPIKIPKSNSANSDLICAAISGWCLLITMMPPEFVSKRVSKWIKTLQGFLEQTDLELRLYAGEALAILIEVGELHEEISLHEQDSPESAEEYSNGHNDKNGDVNYNFLLEKLRKLSTESQKFRTKRDRRQQRHSFRDYLHAIEEGEGPDQSIKFGHGETLEIDTWQKKRQYDAISQALGSGINRHLIDNILIRTVLELGAPVPNLPDGAFSSKAAKSERHYINSVNFKNRCVTRGKNRDVRRDQGDLSEF